MEHYGIDAFYLSEQAPLAMSDRNRGQLHPSLQWEANLPVHRHPPQRAPPTKNSQAVDDGFPLAEAGSLSCVNPSMLHITPEDAFAPCQDAQRLDNTTYLNSGSGFHDFGYNSSIRSNCSQNVPSHDLLLQFFSSVHPEVPQRSIPGYPRPSMIPRGDNGRQHPQFPYPSTLDRNIVLPNVIAPVSTGKRPRDPAAYPTDDDGDDATRPAKLVRIRHVPNEPRKSNPYNHSRTSRSAVHDERQWPGVTTHTAEQKGRYKLKLEQKEYIKQWFKKFTKGEEQPYVASEEINAFATLVKAPPQAVADYIQDRVFRSRPALSSDGSQPASPLLSGPHNPSASFGRKLRDANGHLDGATLDLVERYVSASQRRRAQSDGRRKVNMGPFRCTFNCGYRTKRSFDWRRHEETHEPQELWLCHLCRQNIELNNPFLVNRKDKFIKHVKDTHKGREPEDVLEMSKVEYRANFDPKCPICDEVSPTWDERCKHVLTHYEDEIHEAKTRDAAKGISMERSGSSSDNKSTTPEHTGSSDDDPPERMSGDWGRDTTR